MPVALQSVSGIVALEFDRTDRTLLGWHEGPVGALLERLDSLGFGARPQASEASPLRL